MPEFYDFPVDECAECGAVYDSSGPHDCPPDGGPIVVVGCGNPSPHSPHVNVGRFTGTVSQCPGVLRVQAFENDADASAYDVLTTYAAFVSTDTWSLRAAAGDVIADPECRPGWLHRMVYDRYMGRGIESEFYSDDADGLAVSRTTATVWEFENDDYDEFPACGACGFAHADDDDACDLNPKWTAAYHDDADDLAGNGFESDLWDGIR